MSDSSSRRRFLGAAAGALGAAAVSAVALPGTSYAAVPEVPLVTRADHPAALYVRGTDRKNSEPLNATVDCALTGEGK
ncbi:ubiquinol-cytochrome c reductase iron-sulfur subunit N-terminal domain-containing protein [Streptomyces sp. NBC_01077]|uniref:ubiquinol-cytochrome c reductase iron-sulfur subunit N-terminal domain-containing protein n=1 Tax=Streptomyces sp. NBC_01077 TaxID=2903746 RepID=UPI00386EC08C